MAKQYKVAVIVGSLRKESFSRKTANALIKLAPAELKLGIVEIGDLTFFNQDLEKSPHESWVKFRDAVKATDAVLFVTPEYNRSIPGVLKNAIDVGSRPYGSSVWDGKPGAVLSVSPGAIGAFGANHHLRQMLTFLNVITLQQPEAYVGNAGSLIDDKGELTNDKTREFLEKFLGAFATLVGKLAA